MHAQGFAAPSLIVIVLIGLDDEDGLHQYVMYDTADKQKGPRRIVLDDNKTKNVYTPPKSLTVHLSKIDMPELQPKAAVAEKSGKDKGNKDKSKDKDRSNKDKDKPSKDHKKKEKEEKKGRWK